MVCPVCKNLNMRPIGGLVIKKEDKVTSGHRNYICDDCGYSCIILTSYSNYAIVKKGVRRNGSR